MNLRKNFIKNNPHRIFLATLLGAMLAVGGSVWATTVGTNVTVSGYLTTSGTTASSSVTYALGIATTTPSNTLSVVGDTYITRGLGVGIATTTTGALEMTGSAYLAGALSVTGASAFQGLSSLLGGILVNNATSTIRNLDMVLSTSTQATSTYLNVSTLASTSALRVSNLSTLTGGVLTSFSTSTISNLDMVSSTSTQATSTYLYVSGRLWVGAGGTGGSATTSAIAAIRHGWCDFGPIIASQSIVASTTGVVACTGQAPQGHAADDKVWLTASTTASGFINGGMPVMYTGMASSTAAGRIQAMVFNGTGAAWTVTTSSWQYLIVK